MLAVAGLLLFVAAPWLAHWAASAGQVVNLEQGPQDRDPFVGRAFLWAYRFVGLVVISIAVLEACWPMASG